AFDFQLPTYQLTQLPTSLEEPMGSERARVSYDPQQHYRSVVMQQGRVTLEAEFNEELAIAGEELREETRDIVGPSGTPDDGYLVTPLTNPIFDISVGPGTMYVGGLRVTTPPHVPLAALAEGIPNLDGASKKFLMKGIPNLDGASKKFSMSGIR